MRAAWCLLAAYALWGCTRSDPPSTQKSSSPESPTAAAPCAETVENDWLERTEDELDEALRAAKVCAKKRMVNVLLAFGAPWCADCREMVRISREDAIAALLRERYQVVRINVGNWDRHEGLRKRYGVKSIAHYVVLDPSGKVVAQTTLEPITGQKIEAETFARWLRDPK